MIDWLINVKRAALSYVESKINNIYKWYIKEGRIHNGGNIIEHHWKSLDNVESWVGRNNNR